MDLTSKDRVDEQGRRTGHSLLTTEQYYIIYAVCHVTGMLSACANPVIYGYLNENFNREFKDLAATIRSKCHSNSLTRRQEPKEIELRPVGAAGEGAQEPMLAQAGGGQQAAQV